MHPALCSLFLSAFLIPAPRAEPKAPPRVTAPELVRTFLTNEARADELYADRQVAVSGKVQRITRSRYASARPGEPEYVLQLDQQDPGRAQLDLLFFFTAADRKALAALEPGQEVMVVGRCGRRIRWSGDRGKGERDYSEVHFRPCRLVRE